MDHCPEVALPGICCSLAPGHGGPHFDDGLWWEVRDNPPDWSPPRFTVAVELRDHDWQPYSTVIVNPDGPTDVNLPDPARVDMRLTVHRLG